MHYTPRWIRHPLPATSQKGRTGPVPAGEPAVISGDKGRGTLPHTLVSSSGAHDRRHYKSCHLWRSDMPVRPHDLAARMSGAQQPKIFKLPIDAARRKAREIIDQAPQGNYTPVVENWRQLPNGQIEFTMRHLPTTD